MIGQHIPVTADAIVYTGGGRLAYVHLAAGAGAAATLILYDNVIAAGTVLATLSAPAGGNDSWGCGISIPFSTGVYADIGGAGAAADVILA